MANPELGREEEQKPELEPVEMIYLKACQGTPTLGVAPDHIWKAVTADQWISPTGENMGWMTVEEAEERFGKENVTVTMSSTLCPSCIELHDNIIASLPKRRI